MAVFSYRRLRSTRARSACAACRALSWIVTTSARWASAAAAPSTAPSCAASPAAALVGQGGSQSLPDPDEGIGLLLLLRAPRRDPRGVKDPNETQRISKLA